MSSATNANPPSPSQNASMSEHFLPTLAFLPPPSFYVFKYTRLLPGRTNLEY